MIFKKNIQCSCCGTPIQHAIHEMRLNTADGLVIWSICDACAGLFDELAEALLKRSKDDSKDTI